MSILNRIKMQEKETEFYVDRIAIIINKALKMRIELTECYSISSIICLTWMLENSRALNLKGRKYLYTYYI